ncbi:hypothetical protein [Aureimonas mangrovi]|uniref:hypothetical protein n=1 Tax=Aureimonas mangrovi TaxID=2758041 RepID=UPI00163DA52B|nr:hypothetical protein [Aureimonas mangrovi]
MLDTLVSANALGLPFDTDNITANAAFSPVGRHHSVLPIVRIVLFRQDPTDPERIIAVFPCEPAPNGQMVGFTTAEGNIACSRAWFDRTTQARERQFGPLRSLLRAKGDHLDVRHRITPAMDRTRRWWRLENEYIAHQGQRSNDTRMLAIDALNMVEDFSGVPADTFLTNNCDDLHVLRARWAAIVVARRHFNIPRIVLAAVFGSTVNGIGGMGARAMQRRPTDHAFDHLLSRLEATLGTTFSRRGPGRPSRKLIAA